VKRILLGIAVMTYSLAALAGSNGLITQPSHYSVTKTLNRLERVVKAKGFTIFARINHAAAAKRDGLTMQPEQVLIFGNPKGGTPLMAASPTVGIDLPLKALAWESANGKVWLTYNTAAYLKHRHHIKGKNAAIKKLDRGLKAMVHKALQ